MTAGATLAFTTKEAQRLARLTPRQLQYWDETGFITPSVAARQGRGAPRLYSFQDLIQLRVASQLRDRLPLQALRRLKAKLDVDAPFASVRFALLPGDDVVYVGPEGHYEAARQPGQIVLEFDVPIREIRTTLEHDVADLRARRGVGEIRRTRGVIGNKAVLEGTRITPQSIVSMLADGWDRDRILTEFPELVDADIDAAIAWQQETKRAG